MEFTIEDVFSGIERASNYIPIEFPSARLRFGEHKSVFRDQGRDFYQVREYDPEIDSVSDILWHLRETNGKVYIREAKVTKDFVVIVLADLSASMIYKSRLLLETIGNIAQTCFHGQDPMGLIGFAEDIIFDELPKVGEGDTYYLLSQLYDYFDLMFSEDRDELKKRGTDFYKAFEFLSRRYKDKRCFVVVISDFIDCEDLVRSSLLEDMTSQHEVVFIFLDDPSEFRVKGSLGYLRQSDIETGRKKVISLRKIRKLEAQLRKDRNKFREALEDINIDSTVLEYEKHFDRLYRFFLKRQESFRV